MASLTYPRVQSYLWRTITPREAIPVYPPPEPLEYPSLPSKPRHLPLDAPFTLSTHIIPAAHLRTLPHAPIPLLPTSDLPKAERTAYNQKIRAQLRLLGSPPPSSGHPILLWNCLNRYVRKGAKGTGLTLFFAHANGFPKEIWEPVIQLIINSPSNDVDEIWSWEAVQHGDSVLLNGESLGCLFDWADNGRDILNFLHYFIPSVATDAPVPTHLRRISSEETQYRKAHGFRARTIVGVGHSYGGCTTTFAALENPKLFSSLILVDPVIIKPYDTEEQGLADHRTDGLIYGALNRREVWSSKEEALAGFKKNPFFNAWDPEVLKLYVECGLYDTKDSSGQSITRLKMPGVQEAIVFAATLTQFEVYQRMKDLDEGIELRWIVPGKPGAGELGSPGTTQLRVWVRPKNSSNVRIPSAGHLIPLEAPRDLAREIESFIQRKYGNISNPRSSL
ncbi:hypothetical protein P691DRAFT_811281 [Macrolepiota fuliginosa MF-IS2]|uniref:AB hydrolase-1 domain-containing protein n=1 Tax=Macrolepiota fuliginosa MF-IS2 TaxID=1400762 RepID=A0A9P6C3G1_9AGAR|nr:hypothetical protein P691DRAFT_811281 [Macrolepiota fuliginosa MF-IS2]